MPDASSHDRSVFMGAQTATAHFLTGTVLPMTAVSPTRADPLAIEADAVPPNAVPHVADLRAIRKIYYKSDGSVMVEALRGIDVAIPRGQYVAIMGASGSGKSTLMNILGCLDRPTAGKYLLDGEDCAGMGDEELSAYRGRKIGFVFQAFNLIPELTIEENVEVPLFYQGLGHRERRERAIETLQTV